MWVFSFPNPVNEYAARTVAAGALSMALAAIAFQQPWILVPLAYGFWARVVTGPTLSPLGQVATRVVAPRLPWGPKPVAGPPKRFAQAIGVVFSTTALVLWFGFGYATAASVVLALLAVAALLESVFGDLPRLHRVRLPHAGRRDTRRRVRGLLEHRTAPPPARQEPPVLVDRLTQCRTTPASGTSDRPVWTEARRVSPANSLAQETYTSSSQPAGSSTSSQPLDGRSRPDGVPLSVRGQQGPDSEPGRGTSRLIEAGLDAASGYWRPPCRPHARRPWPR